MTRRCRIPVLSVERIEMARDDDGEWVYGYMALADGLVEYGYTRRDAALRLRKHINRYALSERRRLAQERKETVA